MASESATSIRLVQATGAATTLLRKDIASIERIEPSLMPASLRESLEPAEIADIIGYLKSVPSTAGIVLFEDDAGFATALADGKGSAALDWGDVGSGRASLTVEGFQRHSRQLPGWRFPIRENPNEGEFRFLQLLMKTRGSKGIMIELADNRSFPPEDRAIRTYYVGKNSTGWTSNELASTAPADWQTFTIDLWKGNGDFTMTGIALTVMGGKASFDRIELLRTLPSE